MAEWPLMAGSRHRPPQLTFVRGYVSFLDLQLTAVDPEESFNNLNLPAAFWRNAEVGIPRGTSCVWERVMTRL